MWFVWILIGLISGSIASFYFFTFSLVYGIKTGRLKIIDGKLIDTKDGE